MIDIGANLLNPAFDADRQEVLRRARAAGVDGVVLTGTSVASSRAGADFASRRGVGDPGSEGESSHGLIPRLFATAGVHPHDATAVEAGWDHEIAGLAKRTEVVAIGETGLDYYRNFSPRTEQQNVFRKQVELAVDLNMPLFVHDRDSEGDTRSILSDYRDALEACVIHCFTGTAADLEGYLEDGHYIGITGWICDERRGRQLMELVRLIPGDRLMIETDAPYLLPRNIVPRPRSRRNEPAFLTWVAERVARCRDEDPVSVQRQTQVNAMRFFGLP